MSNRRRRRAAHNIHDSALHEEIEGDAHKRYYNKPYTERSKSKRKTLQHEQTDVNFVLRSNPLTYTQKEFLPENLSRKILNQARTQQDELQQ